MYTSGFVNNISGDLQIFNVASQAGSGSVTGWKTWTKPRGISTVFIFVVGAGGAGGGGYTSTAGTARGGGGGGASGGQSTLYVAATLIPDTLYISVGRGTVYGASYTSAVSDSFVSISSEAPATDARYLLLNASGGGNGFTAFSGNGGTGGTAGSIPTVATCCLSGLGVATFFVGQAGTAGGTSLFGSTAGTSLSYPTTGLRITGGTGGGAPFNSDVNGGAITAAGVLPGFAADGTNIANRLSLTSPFFGIGGTGGRGINNGTNEMGNNGGIGSGGGGGGGGVTGGGSTNGGNGGDGIVIIQCW